MRQAILDSLAIHLSQQDPGLLGSTRIILPNRRAGLFLHQHLARHAKNAGWAPHMFSMSDFIQDISVLDQGDPVELLFELYEVYVKLADRPESLDDFYARGETMIRDFDEMDKYLVDADALFTNMMDLKVLEEPLAGLDEEQLGFIRQFWSGFHAGEQTPEKEEFLNNWTLLPRMYKSFNKVLSHKDVGYQGMLYREIAERIALGELHDPWEGRTIVAGFNALNRCEKRLFSWLKIRGADFYWDYDEGKLKDKQSEAGRFLRENLQNFPQAFALEDFKGLDESKEYRIFELPSDVLQVKTVHRILEESSEGDPEDCTDTAVVLCDEDLLLPVLMSLPEDTQEINVTMGYPMKNTPVFAFTDALLRLHHHARMNAEGGLSFYHKDVRAILLHPYYRRVAGESGYKLSQEISSKNLIMVEEALFDGKPDRLIFSPVEDAAGLVEYLRTLFTYILDALVDADIPQQKALDREFIFHLLKHLNKLEKLLKLRSSLSLSLMENLLRKSLSSLRIPFEGEPLSGLQLMGILETRLLDFRHVILISMNEETMPAPHSAPTNIPYSLRLAFQMPAKEDMDAIYAYYFYRLLQRAEKVDFLYNSGSEGVKSGEMSRYLYQLIFEKGIDIIRPGLEVLTREIPPIRVEHSPGISEKLKQYIQQGEEGKYLSPSAINAYIDCSLKFYLRYLAGIGESEEVEESLGAAGFGTVLHDTLHILYSQIAEDNQEKITPEELGALIPSGRAGHVLQETFLKHHYRGRKKGKLEGRNIIMFQVMLRYLKKIIQTDLPLAPFDLISSEDSYERELPIHLSGKVNQLRLGGKIDRVDRIGETIRVIDYKTGGAKQDFSTLESLFDREQGKRNSAALQTLLYAWLVEASFPDEKILPGLYVMSALFGADFDPALEQKNPLEKGRVEDFSDVKDLYLEHLTALLQSLFDPQVPFSQRENDQHCSYCDFAELCSRNTID